MKPPSEHGSVRGPEDCDRLIDESHLTNQPEPSAWPANYTFAVMDPERWHRVEDLFRQALAREEPERSLFMDEQCKSDPDLRGAR